MTAIPGPEISLVIPLYCESQGLADLLERVYTILGGLGCEFECILVDDGSTDSTWDVISAEMGKRPGLRALRLSRNFGKEAALAAGLGQAKGAATIVMDADFEHPPELIPRFVELWRQTGANVVEGVKEPSERQSKIRKFLNGLFFFCFKKTTGFDLKNHSDYKLIDRQVREAWLSVGERALFFRGLVAWMGFERVSLYFKVPKVENRSSRWSPQQLVHLASGGITAFSSVPLHFVTLTGVVFSVGAALLALQTLYNWYMGRAVTGFATVILLQLGIGGLLMLSLGLIGVYVSHIYNEVKGRPRFLVRESLEHG